ncbi:hypothetical protein PAEH1_01405 [Paenalcaligenes hominis]|uniref:Uncharacterized protein n=1 Tax=Paenalcaligenes hominis TaxID=643674 RepID=A0A1U9JXM4_9BURK|nr:hypothetical protein [Paenalcaligenes hominis]AQS50537.1 hypothetical protein PAEH1_01405 [Paenalcaligenes hominis]
MIVIFNWPHRALFPNARNGKHWGSFQQHKVKARNDGYAFTRSAIKQPNIKGERVPLHITFYAPDRRRRDIDGMLGAMKHHIDGMAKALGVDDSVFRPVTIDVELDPAKKGFVLVEVGHA